MKATMFLALLVLGTLVAPWAPDAQQPTKVHRIGWLHPGLSRPEPHPSLEAFSGRGCVSSAMWRARTVSSNTDSPRAETRG
jgi:hypothetical protein